MKVNFARFGLKSIRLPVLCTDLGSLSAAAHVPSLQQPELMTHVIRAAGSAPECHSAQAGSALSLSA